MTNTLEIQACSEESHTSQAYRLKEGNIKLYLRKSWFGAENDTVFEQVIL
jgi:hypothetical protein